MSISLKKLQRQLEYHFHDIDLVLLALTHRSYGENNNERLEFLGDSIVNFVIAESLYKKFPSASEGQLTRLRACLVRGKTMAEIGEELQIGNFVRLGAGEVKRGAHRCASILADMVESLIGAIYLDGGMDVCRQCILSWFSSRIAASLIDDQQNKDPKTRLQEWLQGRQRPLPNYELIKIQGEAHDQTFTVQCQIEEFEPVTGKSNSRRNAEQNAARKILTAVGLEDSK